MAGSELPEKDPRAAFAVAEGPDWSSDSMQDRQSLPKMAKGNGALPNDYTEEQGKTIEELFFKALQGELPRPRPLKYWEPDFLNGRHLSMVMMRASGFHQRVIAKAFGTTDSNISIVLNHPDAEYLLSRLLAMKVAQPGDIQKRLRVLAETAMDSLEDAFTAEDPDALKLAFRRAPLAFKVFDAAGLSAPKKTETQGTVDHVHRLDATPGQLSEISRALRESKEIRDVQYTEVSSPEEMRRLLEGDLAQNSGALSPDMQPDAPLSPDMQTPEPTLPAVEPPHEG